MPVERNHNGVPVLDLSDAVASKVDDSRAALLDPDRETVLLTGAAVHLHNPVPVHTDRPDITTWHIGGETLDEAAKSVIGSYEVFGTEDPSWVASTNQDLAEVIADHYGCPIKSMEEELAP